MSTGRRCMWTHNLSEAERRFVAAMNDLGYGRFESIQINRGALVLNPWPKAIRLREIWVGGRLAVQAHGARVRAYAGDR